MVSSFYSLRGSKINKAAICFISLALLSACDNNSHSDNSGNIKPPPITNPTQNDIWTGDLSLIASPSDGQYTFTLAGSINYPVNTSIKFDSLKTINDDTTCVPDSFDSAMYVARFSEGKKIAGKTCIYTYQINDVNGVAHKGHASVYFSPQKRSKAGVKAAPMIAAPVVSIEKDVTINESIVIDIPAELSASTNDYSFDELTVLEGNGLVSMTEDGQLSYKAPNFSGINTIFFAAIAKSDPNANKLLGQVTITVSGTSHNRPVIALPDYELPNVYANGQTFSYNVIDQGLVKPANPSDSLQIVHVSTKDEGLSVKLSDPNDINNNSIDIMVTKNPATSDKVELRKVSYIAYNHEEGGYTQGTFFVPVTTGRSGDFLRGINTWLFVTSDGKVAGFSLGTEVGDKTVNDYLPWLNKQLEINGLKVVKGSVSSGQWRNGETFSFLLSNGKYLVMPLRITSENPEHPIINTYVSANMPYSFDFTPAEGHSFGNWYYAKLCDAFVVSTGGYVCFSEGGWSGIPILSDEWNRSTYAEYQQTNFTYMANFAKAIQLGGVFSSDDINDVFNIRNEGIEIFQNNLYIVYAGDNINAPPVKTLERSTNNIWRNGFSEIALEGSGRVLYSDVVLDTSTATLNRHSAGFFIDKEGYNTPTSISKQYKVRSTLNDAGGLKPYLRKEVIITTDGQLVISLNDKDYNATRFNDREYDRELVSNGKVVFIFSDHKLVRVESFEEAGVDSLIGKEMRLLKVTNKWMLWIDSNGQLFQFDFDKHSLNEKLPGEKIKNITQIDWQYFSLMTDSGFILYKASDGSTQRYGYDEAKSFVNIAGKGIALINRNNEVELLNGGDLLQEPSDFFAVSSETLILADSDNDNINDNIEIQMCLDRDLSNEKASVSTCLALFTSTDFDRWDDLTEYLDTYLSPYVQYSSLVHDGQTISPSDEYYVQ